MWNSSDPPPVKSEAEAIAEARALALRLLARREHSVQELRFKLTGRGVAETVAAQVVTALCAAGLLSEQRFAEAYVRARFERGFGPVRIAAELRERGLDAELIERALAASGFDWAAAARRHRHKRFGTSPPANFADRARQQRFLQQRGFSHEQLRAALTAPAEVEFP